MNLRLAGAACRQYLSASSMLRQRLFATQASTSEESHLGQKNGGGKDTNVYVVNTVEDRDVAALIKKNLLIDTLETVRRFEGMGLSRQQAEHLTVHITELIVVNREKLEEAFVPRFLLEKIVSAQDGRITNFKSELQNSAEMHAASMSKELERQQSYLDKMRAEMKHEIDKISASQRIDLNLEKGRMRDDIQAMRDKGTDLEIRVDRDINELKSSVEKAKNDTIKSVITILGTFSAIVFTISRLTSMT